MSKTGSKKDNIRRKPGGSLIAFPEMPAPVLTFISGASVPSLFEKTSCREGTIPLSDHAVPTTVSAFKRTLGW